MSKNNDLPGKSLIGCLLLSILVCLPASLVAQDSYRQGQHIEPAYEGWRYNDDGDITFIFGYFNENWEEEVDIAVGENNFFSPGSGDQGQPTHFLPRRNRFTFEVVVPRDWGDQELIWTLISPNGVSRQAFASTRTDYLIDNIVIASETGSLGAGTSSPESRSNVPPRAEVIGDTVRTVRVGEPLSLVTRVTDDGLPKPRQSDVERSEEDARERMLRAPRRNTVGKVNGLFLSWNVYRGPVNTGPTVQETVRFDPPQVKPWEDTRTSANSPWGWLWQPPPIPEDGLYTTRITFDQPGTYTLWGRADDGGLYHDQFITVNVTP